MQDGEILYQHYRSQIGVWQLTVEKKLAGFTEADEDDLSSSWFYTGGQVAGIANLSGIGAAAALRPTTAAQQTITHWNTATKVAGGTIQPDSWVMTGEKSVRNYLFSGVLGKYKFQNAITTVAPKAALKYPKGWEKVKGLLGQRIYRP